MALPSNWPMVRLCLPGADRNGSRIARIRVVGSTGGPALAAWTERGGGTGFSKPDLIASDWVAHAGHNTTNNAMNSCRIKLNIVAYHAHFKP